MTSPDLTFDSPPTDAPADITILVTGIQDNAISPVIIALPSSGQLWIGYEFQDKPAASAVLWHQGGATDTIQPGFNTYSSQPGDSIQYALAYEGQSIKLGWGYESS